MKTLRKLNFPSPKNPQAQETKIFRAFCKVLRNDPILSAATETFLDWSGTEGDTWEPSWGLCPYLRVSPFPTQSDWVTEKQHSSPTTVHLEVATQGTDFDQIGNYWGLIRAALFPQNNPTQRDLVIATLQTAGVTRPTIRLSAFGQQTDDKNQVILVARGSIEFGSLVLT